MDADVLVIGAGPVGLFAAFYAGLRGMSSAIIDSLEEPGGQVSALYPEKLIRDVAGFGAIKGRDLVEALRGQLEPFKPHWRLGSGAIDLVQTDDGFEIVCEDGGRLTGRAVVITGGIGTFTPRPLGVGDQYLSSGVTYFVKDPAALRGKDIVVVGGGDSAFDWADALDGIASSVRLVHRRDRFRAHQDTVARVLTSEVEVLTNAQVTGLEGWPLDTVVIQTREGVRRLQCDHVVAALGFVANLGPLEHWGLDLVDRKIAVDQTMHTNRPGIFAAGDICTYAGRVPLIAVGFGEAATAVNHVAVFLDPHASSFPGHSTDGDGTQTMDAVTPASYAQEVAR